MYNFLSFPLSSLPSIFRFRATKKFDRVTDDERANVGEVSEPFIECFHNKLRLRVIYESDKFSLTRSRFTYLMSGIRESRVSFGQNTFHSYSKRFTNFKFCDRRKKFIFFKSASRIAAGNVRKLALNTHLETWAEWQCSEYYSILRSFHRGLRR